MIGHDRMKAWSGRDDWPAYTLRFALTLLLGAFGGAVFAYLSVPLAWMLGAMFAIGLAAAFGLRVSAPARMRPPVSAVIGTMLGSQFRTETVAALAEWWLVPFALAAYVLTGAVLCYLFLSRVVRIDPVTAFYSAMPGGLVDMVVMGAEKGGDERTIALLHASRIFLVVSMLPIILGQITTESLVTVGAAWIGWDSVRAIDVGYFAAAMALGLPLGRVMRLPAPFLFGPMIASGVLHATGLTTFLIPTGALAGAQVALGTLIGCRFVGIRPRALLRILAVAIGTTLILLTLTLLFAVTVGQVTDLSTEEVLLAFAPGGLTEMSLVALSLQVDVVFVTLCHLLRILIVILGAGLLLRVFQNGVR